MTVVFIHGAGGSSNVWRLQTLHFKSSCAIELQGHPVGSGLTSIEEYAQTVSDYVQQTNVSNPVFVGHSMGGAIAIDLALRYPSVRALVLVGTGARLRVRPEFLSAIKSNYEEASKMLASWSVSPTSDQVIAERIAKDLLEVNPGVTLGDFMACDKFDRMKDVEKIRCQTLVLCGADDKMTPPKYSHYLHENIKGSKLVIVPGTGHVVMLEKHRAFNQELEAFLVSLGDS